MAHSVAKFQPDWLTLIAFGHPKRFPFDVVGSRKSVEVALTFEGKVKFRDRNDALHSVSDHRDACS